MDTLYYINSAIFLPPIFIFDDYNMNLLPKKVNTLHIPFLNTDEIIYTVIEYYRKRLNVKNIVCYDKNSIKVKLFNYIKNNDTTFFNHLAHYFNTYNSINKVFGSSSIINSNMARKSKQSYYAWVKNEYILNHINNINEETCATYIFLSLLSSKEKTYHSLKNSEVKFKPKTLNYDNYKSDLNRVRIFLKDVTFIHKNFNEFDNEIQPGDTIFAMPPIIESENNIDTDIFLAKDEENMFYKKCNEYLKNNVSISILSYPIIEKKINRTYSKKSEELFDASLYVFD